MKANEYFKKHGLDIAKRAVAECNYGYGIDLDDLKRLVESHGIVKACGGIHMARADVMDLDGFEKTSPYWMKIKQAIADVESCQ